jgi:hypothetical protein
MNTGGGQFNTTGATFNTSGATFNTSGAIFNTGAHFGSSTDQPRLPSFNDLVDSKHNDMYVILPGIDDPLKKRLLDKWHEPKPFELAISAKGQAILLPDSRFLPLPIARRQGGGGGSARIEYTHTWGGDTPKKTIEISGEAHDGKGNSVGGHITHSNDGKGGVSVYAEKQAGDN